MIELSYAHDKQWVDMFVGTVPDVLMVHLGAAEQLPMGASHHRMGSSLLGRHLHWHKTLKPLTQCFFSHQDF